MKKVEKGLFEYLSYKKKWEIVKTVLLFLLSASIYLIGYLTTKTNKNLLTIVAVLGCLPASKSAVNMIMYFRVKGCSNQVKEKIEQSVGKLNGYYHLYFTSYDKNYDISHLVVTKNSIIAYTESKKIDEANFNKHIEQLLTKEKLNHITIKLFFDLDKYLSRLKQLNHTDENISEDKNITKMLFSVSL